MDRFNEYWELLSDKSVPIGKELITYYKTLNENEDGATLSERSCSFLLQNLIQNPYPTCQLLRLLATSKIPYKNSAIREICDTGIMDFFGSFTQNNIDKLYNLISNNLLSTDVINKLVPIVLLLLEEKKIDRELILLALLSRKSQKMLKHFIKQMKVAPEQQYVLGVVENKTHFLNSVLDTIDVPFQNVDVRKYIHFFQLIKYLNTKGGVSSISAEWETPPNNALGMYSLEMKRTLLLQEFLEGLDHSLHIEEYAKETSVIAMYLKNKIKIAPSGYEQLLGIIEENDRLNIKILKAFYLDAQYVEPLGDAKCMHILMLWQYVIEMMKLSPQLKTFESVLESRVCSIKTILKSIDSSEMFVDILENLLTLLFVRYEHLSRKPPGRIGFICSDVVMESILNCLKLILMPKIHTANYSSTDDKIKLRLNYCQDIINESLWRLTKVVNICAQSESSFQLVDADFNIIIVKSELIQENEVQVFHSSESLPDRCNKYSTFPKKKHSKRRSHQSQLSSSGSTGNKAMQYSLPLPGKISSIVDPSISAIVVKPRNIFSKMLGTPEKLATLCLASHNLDTARNIIKQNQLGNTPVGLDLSYLENFSQVQQKLSTLITNYNRMQQEKPLGECSSMLENIRVKTAIGFEASKIISTIETFSNGQKIHQGEEEIGLLNKFVAQYPLLKFFRGEFARNIPAMDLLLGLRMGYDLNLTMYHLISKSLDKSDSDDVMKNTYVAFLKRMIDDLQQFKCAAISGQYMTLHALLSSEVCSLDPAQLGLTLEARRSLKTLESLEDFQQYNRKGHWSSLKKIQIFIEGMQQLGKLQSSWNDALKANDLIKTNIGEVITQLAFEKAVPLQTLENLAVGTNANLVHILSQKYFVDIRKHSDNNTCRNAEILEYIGKKNELLGGFMEEFTSIDRSDNFLKRLNELSCFDAISPLYKSRISAIIDYDQPQLDALGTINVIGDLQRIQLYDALGCRKRQDYENIQHRRHEIVTRLLQFDDPVQELPLEKIIRCTKNVVQKVEYLFKIAERLPRARDIMKLINSILLSKNVSKIDKATREHMENWLSQLQVYEEIGTIIEIEDWRTVKNLSESNKDLVLHQLIQKNQYDLCSRWIDIHPLKCDEDSTLLDIFTLAVIKATKEKENCSVLLVLIEQMPTERVVRFYETILLGVKDQEVIRHAVEYLEKNGDNRKIYQKYRISLEIFNHLSMDESERLWHLISRPLLIIEQYLMNSKLELLTGVMVSIRSLLLENMCKICYEQREYIRDLRSSDRLSGSINLDSSHDDQFLTNECVDCLLRIYAGKALDYRVFGDHGTSGESMHDQSGEYSSMDSLCGAFIMPKEVPTREAWIRDEDASHCMCCRRSVFSMLNRRHHCRRCGRVVCHSCSKKKLEIPEFYEKVPVRACDDCVKQSQNKPNVQIPTHGKPVNMNDSDQWQLTGNVRNDNIIRDEYSYEYAPSTNQCLAICNLHNQNEEISNFLLYHCAKLESLLRPILPGFPNPEIDYALVARMLLNLALAAKVRGLQFTEADKVKEHAEIILSIVKNDCESLLLQESMTSANLRRLRDALVKAEKWKLAIELSLKCGFATSGVMAAWGTTCLRAGCYETAREKFSHCLQKLLTDTDYCEILDCIECPVSNLSNYKGIVPVKRPVKSPPLLLEIISILESTAQAQPPEVIARASVVKNSNSSVSFSIHRKTKENITLHEPALNVLNTLSNLKHITKGNFTDFLPEKRALRTRDPPVAATNKSTDYLHALDCIMSTRFFEESMFYLLSYGAHHDNISFLIKHRQILSAMKYTLMQQVDPEVFLQTIILPFLKTGRLETVIQVMSSMDETLLIWKNYIIHTCRYLETNRMLNCLYNLQLLLRDPIRASMTCVRFYSMDAKNFIDLEANTFHLKNSVAHLQAELELCNWEEISVESFGDRSETHKSLLMKMEPKELNNHINTILRQLEVTKFLANCESKERDVIGLIPKLFIESSKIPTLFGTTHERLQLAVLILICGQNIEEGFGLSYRVIQDFNLNSLRVYGLAAKYFISHTKVEEVEKLLQAIISNSSPTVDTSSFCDELVKVSVETAVTIHGNSAQIKTALEALIKRISDVGLKIHCYIVTGQLKTAYLLANKTGRIGDIRKISRQAEVLNQVHVKRLCEMKLTSEGGSRK
ncbi:zinc finger FYVE domain-containing protein 26 homolog [Topomyia yanbarensis]|uniref:zinc finger FYVE domain-containing protein 26 homolog n=1 Tax=Topomyia yanbarensis TaxID=2498891 RepID=UPI00273C8134|nr:zinc finger FYVE domain-containing protein 26 homolog [Topomyia yanbarensis]